ncbi:hypothetical protein FACS189476_00760 [Spirochaetia bacterium]|nr:hypothetical protein FACS189476_00760 [Spirochaetia bacterium]
MKFLIIILTVICIFSLLGCYRTSHIAFVDEDNNHHTEELLKNDNNEYIKGFVMMWSIQNKMSLFYRPKTDDIKLTNFLYCVDEFDKINIIDCKIVFDNGDVLFDYNNENIKFNKRRVAYWPELDIYEYDFDIQETYDLKELKKMIFPLQEHKFIDISIMYQIEINGETHEFNITQRHYLQEKYISYNPRNLWMGGPMK